MDLLFLDFLSVFLLYLIFVCLFVCAFFFTSFLRMYFTMCLSPLPLQVKTSGVLEQHVFIVMELHGALSSYMDRRQSVLKVHNLYCLVIYYL